MDRAALYYQYVREREVAHQPYAGIEEEEEPKQEESPKLELVKEPVASTPASQDEGVLEHSWVLWFDDKPPKGISQGMFGNRLIPDLSFTAI